MRLINNKNIFLPLAIGLIAFFLIVGYEVLVPTNVGWLQGGDPATYFISWNFFRFSEWTFPLGMNPMYGLISPNSIVYSDTNVLFALFFKLFSKFLPETFQYFGLWILCCFVLQSIFAWKLVSLFSDNVQVRSLTAILFVLSPAFLWRLDFHVMHLMLLGHFLILASLYLAVKFKISGSLNYYQWAILLCVAILVQAYIAFSCFFIFLSVFIDKFLSLKDKKVFELIKFFFITSAIIFLAWTVGFFAVGSGVSANGFGFYKMNLLALIDPSMNHYQPWSYLLPNIPGENGQHEGFNYLGLGLILFSLLSIRTFFKNKTEILVFLNKYKYFRYALIFLTLYALSNVIHFAGFKVLKIPLPDYFLNVLNVFRASGRVFWPVFYTIILFNVYLLVKYIDQKKTIILMYFFVGIQVIDTSSGWLDINSHLSLHSSGWSSNLNNSFWDKASGQYKKMVYTKPGLPENWENLAYFASQNSMSTNIAYLARYDLEKQNSFYKTLEVNLLNKDFKADTLYILDVDSFSKLYTLIGNDKLCNGDLISIVDGVRFLAPAFNKTQCILK